MDVKGINWIGNIYQKFEAICLEVEEIVYQDTVKFVEDQVESVGASVRKFYSEFMQDLDPPSSVHPGKVAVPEIKVDKWDVGKTYKRPTTCVKNVSARTGPNRVSKGSSGLGIVKEDGRHASSVKKLNIYRKTLPNSALDSQFMKEEELTESRSVSESLVGKTRSPARALGVVPCTERIVQPSLQVLSENPRTMNHPEATVSSAGVEVEKGDSVKDSRDENGLKTRCIGKSSSNVPSTKNNIEGECVGNDGKTENFPLSTDSDGTSSGNAVLSVAAASSDVKEASCLMIPYTENADGADTAHTSGNASIEHNLIVLDNPDRGNLEESCIFIDVYGRHFDALSQGKRRSYKKTIRDAFSSKKKASRVRKYEQLAALYGDPESTEDFGAKSGKGGNSDTCGSSECDWEIL